MGHNTKLTAASMAIMAILSLGACSTPDRPPRDAESAYLACVWLSGDNQLSATTRVVCRQEAAEAFPSLEDAKPSKRGWITTVARN